MKVYCIEFLTAAVDRQPGLAEHLLGVSSASENNIPGASTSESRPKTNGDSGALNCVLSILKSDRILPDLAIACVNLLSTIWCSNNTAAMDYLRQKRKEEFWPVLLAPLSAGEETYFLTIVSPIFRILTRELFASSAGAFASRLKSVNGAAISKSTGSDAIITTVIQEIMDVDRLKLAFKKLQEYCESRIDFKEKVDVLSAWNYFLQVIFSSKMNGGPGDDGKKEILIGSMNVLKITVSSLLIFITGSD